MMYNVVVVPAAAASAAVVAAALENSYGFSNMLYLDLETYIFFILVLLGCTIFYGVL